MIGVVLLTPSSVNASLQACGYRPDLLRTGFPFGDGQLVPLAAFAQSPTDSRSACVAVLSGTSGPRVASKPVVKHKTFVFILWVCISGSVREFEEVVISEALCLLPFVGLRLRVSLSTWPMSAVSNPRQGESSERTASARRRKKMIAGWATPQVRLREGTRETCEFAASLRPTLPKPFAG